jgi:hypothetical protein
MVETMLPPKQERANIALLLNEVKRLSERVFEIEKYRVEAEEKFIAAQLAHEELRKHSVAEIVDLKAQIASIQQQLERLESLSSSLVDHVTGIVEP